MRSAQAAKPSAGPRHSSSSTVVNRRSLVLSVARFLKRSARSRPSVRLQLDYGPDRDSHGQGILDRLEVRE